MKYDKIKEAQEKTFNFVCNRCVSCYMTLATMEWVASWANVGKKWRRGKETFNYRVFFLFLMVYSSLPHHISSFSLFIFSIFFLFFPSSPWEHLLNGKWMVFVSNFLIFLLLFLFFLFIIMFTYIQIHQSYMRNQKKRGNFPSFNNGNYFSFFMFLQLLPLLYHTLTWKSHTSFINI